MRSPLFHLFSRSCLERVSFHCFLVVQADNQVRHTSLKVLHGTDNIDELVFDDAMEL